MKYYSKKYCIRSIVLMLALLKTRDNQQIQQFFAEY